MEKFANITMVLALIMFAFWKARKEARAIMSAVAALRMIIFFRTP